MVVLPKGKLTTGYGSESPGQEILISPVQLPPSGKAKQSFRAHIVSLKESNGEEYAITSLATNCLPHMVVQDHLSHAVGKSVLLGEMPQCEDLYYMAPDDQKKVLEIISTKGKHTLETQLGAKGFETAFSLPNVSGASLTGELWTSKILRPIEPQNRGVVSLRTVGPYGRWGPSGDAAIFGPSSLPERNPLFFFLVHREFGEAIMVKATPHRDGLTFASIISPWPEPLRDNVYTLELLEEQVASPLPPEWFGGAEVMVLRWGESFSHVLQGQDAPFELSSMAVERAF